MTAYQFRVTLVPLLDLAMLAVVKRGHAHKLQDRLLFWSAVISSTAGQAIVSSLQFNAQMTFFASRVDPAIGGSYMTLLNTAANLGGTWSASLIMKLVGFFTKEEHCVFDEATNSKVCTGTNQDPYAMLQIGSSILGLLWIFLLKKRVQTIAQLPDDAWRTHLLDDEKAAYRDIESPEKPIFRKRVFGNKRPAARAKHI